MPQVEANSEMVSNIKEPTMQKNSLFRLFQAFVPLNKLFSLLI